MRADTGSLTLDGISIFFAASFSVGTGKTLGFATTNDGVRALVFGGNDADTTVHLGVWSDNRLQITVGGERTRRRVFQGTGL